VNGSNASLAQQFPLLEAMRSGPSATLESSPPSTTQTAQEQSAREIAASLNALVTGVLPNTSPQTTPQSLPSQTTPAQPTSPQASPSASVPGLPGVPSGIPFSWGPWNIPRIPPVLWGPRPLPVGPLSAMPGMSPFGMPIQVPWTVGPFMPAVTPAQLQPFGVGAPLPANVSTPSDVQLFGAWLGAQAADHIRKLNDHFQRDVKASPQIAECATPIQQGAIALANGDPQGAMVSAIRAYTCLRSRLPRN
jgi:hypothetical protein